jgi:hypothetical protein
MTDEEYREILRGFASEYLHFGQVKPELGHKLQSDLENLAWLNRLVQVTKDRPDDSALMKRLLAGLRDARIDSVHDAMSRIGMLCALDEERELIFRNLRPSAIPTEDFEFLRRAGIQNPEIAITVAIEYGQRHIADSKERPSDIVSQAVKDLRKQVDEFEKNSWLQRNASGSMGLEKY